MQSALKHVPSRRDLKARALQIRLPVAAEKRVAARAQLTPTGPLMPSRVAASVCLSWAEAHAEHGHDEFPMPESPASPIAAAYGHWSLPPAEEDAAWGNWATVPEILRNSWSAMLAVNGTEIAVCDRDAPDVTLRLRIQAPPHLGAQLLARFVERQRQGFALAKLAPLVVEQFALDLLRCDMFLEQASTTLNPNQARFAALSAPSLQDAFGTDEGDALQAAVTQLFHWCGDDAEMTRGVSAVMNQTLHNDVYTAIVEKGVLQINQVTHMIVGNHSRLQLWATRPSTSETPPAGVVIKGRVSWPNPLCFFGVPPADASRAWVHTPARRVQGHLHMETQMSVDKDSASNGHVKFGDVRVRLYGSVNQHAFHLLLTDP